MVLLSASALAVHRFQSQEDRGYPSIFDARYSRSDWSILTALLVKWDKGHAQRLALAYMNTDAWKEAGPKEKLVLLA